MPVTADFGIKSTFDDAAITRLLDQLNKIIDGAPKIAAAFNSVQSKVSASAEKISQSFVDSDGKITKSKELSSQKVQAEIDRIVIAAERAAQREIQSAESTDTKLTAIAAKGTSKSEAELAKVAAAFEKSKQREEESARRADEKLNAIAEKAAQRAQAEAAKIVAAFERSKQREVESEQKAQEKIDAIAKREEAQKQAAAAREEARIAKSKGRTIAELEEKLHLHDKSRKEIIAMEEHLSHEVDEVAKKLTLTLDGEEKKRLKATQDELKSELAAVKHESEERGIASKKEEHKGGGVGIAEVAGVGAAIEGFKLLTEKSEEAVAAQKQLQIGTGQTGKELQETGKQAEEIGNKFAMSGDSAKAAMGKVASYTGATGEELSKQTEAVLAYAAAHGKNGEMVAKQFATEKGRAKIMAEAELNIAKATEAANTPAANMARIQNTLMETVGKTAMVILNAFGPAIAAVVPLVQTIGEMIESVVKPAMDSIVPVFVNVAKSIKDLVPPIIDLVSNALSLLTPVLGIISKLLEAILPVIGNVVKTVVASLTPVFKALTPIIQQLASVLGDGLTDVLTAVLVPALNALLPILTGLLVPVLMSLMPLLTLVANIISGVLTPTLKILTGIINFVVTGAIQPLVGWLTGTLTKAIESVVGVITKVTSAISSIVSAVGSVLGASDAKAAESTKKTGEKVLDAQKETEEKSHAAKLQEQFRTEKEHQAHLQTMLKLGKLSAAEEQELREHATEEGNDVVLAKLDAYDKKKASQAEAASRKGAAAAKKDAKSLSDAAIAAANDELNAKKLAVAAMDLTDRDAKIKNSQAEVEHAQEVLEIQRSFYGENSKQFIQAQRQLQGLQISLRKQERSDIIADNKEDTDAILAQLEQRALREGLSEKQIADEKFKIERSALAQEIEIRRSFGEDVSKLEMQLGTMDLKQADDRAKHAAGFVELMGKIKLENRKTELEQMKAHGAALAAIEQAETKIALDEEDARFKDELQKRKGDDLLIQAEVANHEGKVQAITRASADKQKAILQQQAQYLAGPIAQGFNAGFKNMMKGADEWTEKMAQSNNVLESVFGNILKGFLDMIEGMIEKIVAMEAVLLVANLIPGFGAFMKSLDEIGSLIPGHAEGTDSSPGGWHYVGEKGVELVNMKPGAQVIPNHKIGMGAQPQMDLTPLISRLDSIHRATLQTSVNVLRPRNILPVNDSFRGLLNQSQKAEARRSA